MPSRIYAFVLAGMTIAAAGCGGAATSSTSPSGLTLALASNTVIVPQDGTAATLGVTVTGPSAAGTVGVTVSGLPNGVTEQFATTGSGPSGSVMFTGSGPAAAGSYAATVQASAGGQSASQTVTLIVAAVATVGSSVDMNQGLNGRLEQFLSTSFQPAEWDYTFFQNHPTQIATLNDLGSQHIRIQGVSEAVPMLGNTGTASDWDFTKLDAIVQPVLGVADNSPEFQVAVAPVWMRNASGDFDIGHHLNDFAAYAANLVKYYNAGGFDWGGIHFQSGSSHRITWWGIFNEFNINGLTAPEYIQLYNTVVPAMLAVDPAIKFSALEFSDFGLGTGDSGDPKLFLPAFVAAVNAGGVSVPVDVVSTHFYGTCNQKNTDSQVFGSVAQFVNNVKYFRQELGLRADLANVPIWVTENNVNADFGDANGQSVCNPGQKFVVDQRGTSAFFAAWRPYVFSQLGKAGNQAVYHWDYGADQQYGEVDYSSGNIRLSYWVDQTLAAIFPSTPSSPGPDILNLAVTDSSTVEVLATKNSDGSVVVMVVDRAVHASAGDNGVGDSRTVIVSLAQLGKFSSANELTIDANTSLTTGPTTVSLTPSPRMSITLGGYGVTFLIMKR